MAGVSAAILKMVLGLVAPLITEKFIKRMIVLGAEHIAKRTETEADDQLVSYIKEAWEIPEG